ncbi:phosphoserine phosphatase SerB [Lactococcus termiticola]|uniref:phosphoserine phosphatase n=1 Tax=Lactococcus termiticola TaxID=2169526 RepID=A0A2R5HFG5_9LACT|nr:phosphoserine phosphatase SerB [Lactococcus termiticola]GBG96752.1 phosphoserine phosphatase [Lactococcus termiticola]
MAEEKRLLVMDVDGTLINEEVIDLLGELAGRGQAIAELTARAMKGELDFRQALTDRVALLNELPVSVFDQVYDKISLTMGVEAVVKEAHERGWKVGLVSGGFHEIVDRLVDRLRIDYALANRLEVKSGRLTGRLKGELISPEIKLATLKAWAEVNSLPLSQTIAVGDGANDILMLQAAGIGIAFCAKPATRKAAAYHLDERDLKKLLPIIDQVSNQS